MEFALIKRNEEKVAFIVSCFKLTDVNMKVIFAVMNTTRAVVKLRPEFFSGFIFTTAQVVLITAKITFIFTSLSVVQIYDFHIFTVVYCYGCSTSVPKFTSVIARFFVLN